jgi:hypothetical protein
LEKLEINGGTLCGGKEVFVFGPACPHMTGEKIF